MIRYANRMACAGMDAAVSALMNGTQWRLRRDAVTRERLETYLSDCERLDRGSYYALPSSEETLLRRDGSMLSWNSPLPGAYHENNTARARIHEAPEPSGAPTLILLHALMSASDIGYRRIAERFNRKGWNVLFPHLPYHYSRTPKGYGNGQLAITSDLIRNAEALRQSVTELRQVLAWARSRGSDRIALLATSYGAWVASLALSLEPVDFAILLQPVADVSWAVFGSPASRTMSGLLLKNGVNPTHLDRHAHLSRPDHSLPVCSPDRILIIGGRYDRMSPPESLRELCRSWGGARYREVEQGHFGYRAMKTALAESELFVNNRCQS